MELKTEAVLLRTISYSDTTSIAVMLTREAGIVSALTPAGQSREANRRRAVLMPMSIVNVTLAGKSISDLPRLKQVERTSAPEFRENHIKNITALFLSDVLNTLLPRCEPDISLFDYVRDSIILFAGTTGSNAIANFHIAFLVGLQHKLGINPDLSTYRRGFLFDMNAGIFRASSTAEGGCLSREESETAFTIGRMTYRNSPFFKLNRSQRNRVLDIILQYFSIHLRNIMTLSSLDVIRAIF